MKLIYLQNKSLLRKYPNVKDETVDYSKKFIPNVLITDSPTDLVPEIKSRSISLSSKSKQVLYDVKITTDSFARRVTPTPKNPQKNIIFLGDSFVFGEGVNDNETFPYFLSLLRPDSAIYNIGAPGLGVNDFLYDLTQSNRLKYMGIPKRKTIVLYTFINDHISRFFCGLNCYQDGQSWRSRKPHFDDELNYKGSYSEDHSFKSEVFRFLAMSKLIKFLNLNWPIFYTNYHYDLFARAVLKLKNSCELKFNSQEFYFVFYPRNPSFIYAKDLIPFLDKYHIQYFVFDNIDYSEVADGIDAIPLDLHPTPMAHFLSAYLLDQVLPK